MNKIWTILGISALAMSLATTSFAQSAGPKGGSLGQATGAGGHKGQEGAMKVNREILAQLNLTRDEQAKIKVLEKDTKEKIKTLRQSPAAVTDKKALREQVRAIQKGYRESLMQILTTDQQAQYKKLWEETMHKMHHGAAGGANPPVPGTAGGKGGR